MADMAEKLKAFLAIAAILAGAMIIIALPYNGFFWDHTAEAFIGVILLAGGLTRFWMRSRFFRKDSQQ